MDRLAIDYFQIQMKEVIALAERSKLTVYDASYLWLAQSLGAELVTLDNTLARAAQRLTLTQLRKEKDGRSQ